jgi:hypothetical protein
LNDDARGNPTSFLGLDCTNADKTGQTWHSRIPGELSGKLSGRLAVSFETGSECLVEGRIAYCRASGGNGEEKAGIVVVGWHVTIASPPLPRPMELPNG